ncbi:MAG: MBL fold metallo-hydrolase, partial [Planctomycetes bacterium]|nr:MBL fold metallo-hydrolase [Planctomycetota bacterium]
MRVTPLASGSQGNSVLLEIGRHRLLVDAGLECEELEARLAQVSGAPRSVDAILLT